MRLIAMIRRVLGGTNRALTPSRSSFRSRGRSTDEGDESVVSGRTFGLQVADPDQVFDALPRRFYVPTSSSPRSPGRGGARCA